MDATLAAKKARYRTWTQNVVNDEQRFKRSSVLMPAKNELVLKMKSISVNDRTVVLTIGRRPQASAQPGDAATGFPCGHRPCTWGLLLNQFVVRVCSAL